MTKFELILMRHAKSDWGNPGLGDHDRPLNRRGERDAPRMGQWLLDNGLIPDVVLCSSACRATQTVEQVVKQWKCDVPVRISEDLYHASPEAIIKHVTQHASDEPRVMAVGHNPGMEVLAGHFSGACGHFPTAAVSVIEFAIAGWSDLKLASRVSSVKATRPKAMD